MKDIMEKSNKKPWSHFPRKNDLLFPNWSRYKYVNTTTSFIGMPSLITVNCRKRIKTPKEIHKHFLGCFALC
jgi:hypothetical protein